MILLPHLRTREGGTHGTSLPPAAPRLSGHTGQGQKDKGMGKGSRWPQKLATSLQLGAMPCAYVLASSARQDEEQALACQPLPMTPETLTSLSWKQDWVRLLIDSGWAEGRSVWGGRWERPHT